MIVFDLTTGDIQNSFQLPVTTKEFVCAENLPIIFCYGESGYVDAYVIPVGTLIDILGPFK
jgi:hypothetical protein